VPGMLGCLRNDVNEGPPGCPTGSGLEPRRFGQRM